MNLSLISRARKQNGEERKCRKLDFSIISSPPLSLLSPLSPSLLLLCRSPHLLSPNLILPVSFSDPRIASHRSAHLRKKITGGLDFRGDLGDAGDGLKGLCTAKLEQHARPRRGGRGRRDSVNSRSPRDRGECFRLSGSILSLSLLLSCIHQQPTAPQHMVFTFP